MVLLSSLKLTGKHVAQNQALLSLWWNLILAAISFNIMPIGSRSQRQKTPSEQLENSKWSEGKYNCIRNSPPLEKNDAIFKLGSLWTTVSSFYSATHANESLNCAFFLGQNDDSADNYPQRFLFQLVNDVLIDGHHPHIVTLTPQRS